MQIAVIAMSQNCEAGVMDQLCASVTSFLDEESAKADAAAKACKKNCRWKKSKDDLIDAARKKAKESCAKGEAPDINEVSKGLDGNAKARLKNLYDNNSRMFDGTAKLKAVDFNAASSKDAAVTGKTAVLGKGGQVVDLKSSEPATPKLNSATEFSLGGTKQSSALLASVSSAKTSADTVSVSSAKSPAAATASAAENQPSAKSQSASSDGNYNTACLQALKLKCGCLWDGVCSGEALVCYEKEKETCRIGGGGCSPGQVLNAKGDCVAPCPDGKTAPDLNGNCPCGKQTYDPKAACCSADGKLYPGQVPDGKGGCGCAPGQVLSGWWIFKKCVPACGGKPFNTAKKCCMNGKILEKCGAECYDPKTTCCKDGKTYAKCEGKCYKPDVSCCIKNTVMSRHEIKTLSDCTERYRGPLFQWKTGCQAKTPWYSFQNKNNPAGGKKTSFESACNAHIECYSACNMTEKARDKKDCDKDFQPALNDICKKAETTQEQVRCLKYAIEYTLPTAPMLVQEFHDESQRKQCTCCPPK